jgi:hypothetical protein
VSFDLDAQLQDDAKEREKTTNTQEPIAESALVVSPPITARRKAMADFKQQRKRKEMNNSSTKKKVSTILNVLSRKLKFCLDEARSRHGETLCEEIEGLSAPPMVECGG